MGLASILEGHTNELLGLNKDISKARMTICKKCPLCKYTLVGPVCNPNLWVNTKTNEISESKKDGFENGCGCRLEAKTTLVNAICPLNKWD